MKILIVDDEPLARERLKLLIAQFPGHEVVGQAGDGRTALQQVEAHQPDVVLLDIRMPGMDGLQVARKLAGSRVPPAIIFTTGFSEHALSAFDTSACAYLLKPIKKDRLGEALRQARRPSRAQLETISQNLQRDDAAPRRSHIVATSRDGQVRIPVDEIVYFQADQKYTTVYHLQGEELIEESLKHLEDDLAPQFLRVHRKILVNTAYIIGLERSDSEDGHGAQLSVRHTEAKLPVSRRRLAEVRRLLFKDSSE